MTETVMLVSNPYDGERRAGTVGIPLPQVDVRLAEEDRRDPRPWAERAPRVLEAPRSRPRELRGRVVRHTSDVGEVD
ncbi:MAG: hypothetical protein R2701_07010 [Acidimicrobiales bacterium]